MQREKNSEYITPEHLLYAATFDERFVEYALENCGGSLENLRYNLNTYIRTYMEESKVVKKPQESIEFQKVILNANEQIILNSGKDVIDVDHIISAIYNLEDSYARYYLEKKVLKKRIIIFIMS